VDKIAEYCSEIRTWMSQGPYGENRKIHGENERKLLNMFGDLEERDKEEAPFMFVDSNSLINWIVKTDIEEWREATKERNLIDWQTKFQKIKKIKDIRLQHVFTDDSTGTERKHSVNQSPKCKIPLRSKNFLKNRWEQNPEFKVYC
jgi:hypothetical protein